MRQIILSATVALAIIIGCNAFGNDYRAVYEFSYTKDSVNSIVGKDILFLELSKNSSFCFSYDTYLTDSLNSTTEGKKIRRQLMTAAFAKDGSDATSFPHKKSTFRIAKFNSSDSILVKDAIDLDEFEYYSLKSDFKWQICDSTRVIDGYDSCMAVCDYHGREWTVWFTPEIPISDGPWVFCGLPGLIIEAHDKDKLFSFNLLGITSNKFPKKDWTGKGKKTDRISFLKKNYQYLKNRSNNINAELGISIKKSEYTPYLNGLEPDFLK